MKELFTKKNKILVGFTLIYLLLVVFMIYRSFSFDFSNKKYFLVTSVDYNYYFATPSLAIRTLIKFLVFIPLSVCYSLMYPKLDNYIEFIGKVIICFLAYKVIFLPTVIFNVYNLLIYIGSMALYMNFYKKLKLEKYLINFSQKFE